MNELGVLLEESTSSSLPMRPSQMGGGGGITDSGVIKGLGKRAAYPEQFFGSTSAPSGE